MYKKSVEFTVRSPGSVTPQLSHFGQGAQYPPSPHPHTTVIKQYGLHGREFWKTERGNCARFSVYFPLHSNTNFQRDKHLGLILPIHTNTNPIVLQCFGEANSIK